MIAVRFEEEDGCELKPVELAEKITEPDLVFLVNIFIADQCGDLAGALKADAITYC